MPTSPRIPNRLHRDHPPAAVYARRPTTRHRAQIRIVVHPALPSPPAKKEQETLELTRAAIESALHPSMLPLPKEA
eukprot:7391004-Prymnesium_polylepis.2